MKSSPGGSLGASRCEEDGLASPTTCECKKFKHLYRPQRFPRHTIRSPGDSWCSLDSPLIFCWWCVTFDYRPMTKLWGGNISVMCVCQSVHRGRGVPVQGPGPSTLPHNLLFRALALAPSCKGPGPAPPDMFKLVQLGPHCAGMLPGHVHHEAKAVGRRAVGIRLKCLLVVDTWKFRCSGINTVTMCICSSGTVAYSADTRRSSKRHRLWVTRNPQACGLFTLPDTDLESDSKDDGYIVLFPLHRLGFQSRSEFLQPFRMDISIRIWIRVRVRQCTQAHIAKLFSRALTGI